MLRNSKQVISEVVDPLMEDMTHDHIQNEFLEQLREGVESKFTSFARKLDTAFTREFSRHMDSFRHSAWEQAQSKVAKGRTSAKQLKGTKFAPKKDLVLYDIPARTYLEWDLEISLINPYVNTYSFNAYEASASLSGLIGGNPSYQQERMEYTRKLSKKFTRVYIDELDELKYIYRGFWYLTRSCSQSWLEALYREPDKKIIDYNYPSFTDRSGLLYSDDMVLTSCEGVDTYVSVEELYSWIEYYRIPGKRYAIGETEHPDIVTYCIYLKEVFGIPEDLIKERITPDDINLIQAEARWMIGLPPPKASDKEDEVPVEWNLERLLGPHELPQDSYDEVEAEGVDYDYSGLDIERIGKMLDEEDSFPDPEDLEERNSNIDIDLPYNQDLHLSNNEFESIYQRPDEGQDKATLEIYDEDEEYPDNVLNPLEELGIDLIDPSRDNMDQPSMRRIQLTWDPGGGIRPLTRRFLRGTSWKTR
jgi:hypothetical protein